MKNKNIQNSLGFQSEVHSFRKSDEANVTNDTYAPQYDNMNQQMSYHTIKSKSICEKRDLNNIPLPRNESTQIGYDDKGKLISICPTLYGLSSYKENGHHTSFVHQNGVPCDRNINVHEEKETSNRLTSKVGKSQRCKANCFPFLCKININTIICWISCIISVYCVYTTMNLKFRFKAGIVRLTTCF